MDFRDIFESRKTLIGMVHLPPMPGAGNQGSLDKAIEKALTDLETLERAGYDGVLVENDNDRPHQLGVNDAVVKAFTEVMDTVIDSAAVPVGMEIIYDMKNTIKVASETEADFVRLDVFADSVVTRWGTIMAEAETLLKSRQELAPDLMLFTDVQVKHSELLDKTKTIDASTRESIAKGSDALIVTGLVTGNAPDMGKCSAVRNAAGGFPLLVGSGFDINNAKALLGLTDGAIVGTSIKDEEGAYVSFDKAKALADLVHSL